MILNIGHTYKAPGQMIEKMYTIEEQSRGRNSPIGGSQVLLDRRNHHHAVRTHLVIVLREPLCLEAKPPLHSPSRIIVARR